MPVRPWKETGDTSQKVRWTWWQETQVKLDHLFPMNGYQLHLNLSLSVFVEGIVKFIFCVLDCIPQESECKTSIEWKLFILEVIPRSTGQKWGNEKGNEAKNGCIIEQMTSVAMTSVGTWGCLGNHMEHAAELLAHWRERKLGTLPTNF